MMMIDFIKILDLLIFSHNFHITGRALRLTVCAHETSLCRLSHHVQSIIVTIQLQTLFNSLDLTSIACILYSFLIKCYQEFYVYV